MPDRLPPDVLSEVLAELSIGDVGRCSLVCKSWYSLITSPDFVSRHSQRIPNKNDGLFLIWVKNDKPNPNTFSLNLDDESFSEYKNLDFSFKDPNDIKVVACLNGVICLSDNVNIYWWNPTIRKFLELPTPIVPLDSNYFPPCCTIGFGYDAATNDFKVVRVPYYRHPEVYSLSTGRWRKIKKNEDVGLISPYTNQAFLNGSVHWVALIRDEGIVSFDFRTETFGALKMPNCLTSSWHTRWDLRVSLMGELLSLTGYKLVGGTEISFIWVMTEYGVADSWTKMYDVSTNGIYSCEIFCIRRNGEPLLTDTEGKVLYSYVPNGKLVKRLKLFKRKKFDVFNFTESLALLGMIGTKRSNDEEDQMDDKAISKGYPPMFMLIRKIQK